MLGNNGLQTEISIATQPAINALQETLQNPELTPETRAGLLDSLGYILDGTNRGYDDISNTLISDLKQSDFRTTSQLIGRDSPAGRMAYPAVLTTYPPGHNYDTPDLMANLGGYIVPPLVGLINAKLQNGGLQNADNEIHYIAWLGHELQDNPAQIAAAQNRGLDLHREGDSFYAALSTAEATIAGGNPSHGLTADILNVLEFFYTPHDEQPEIPSGMLTILSKLYREKVINYSVGTASIHSKIPLPTFAVRSV